MTENPFILFRPFSQLEIMHLRNTLMVLNLSGARYDLTPEQEAICKRIEGTLNMIQDWRYHPATLQWEYMPADAVVFGGSIITQECGCPCEACKAIYNGPEYLACALTNLYGHCLHWPCTGGKRLWLAFWDGKRLGEDTDPQAMMRAVEAEAERLKREHTASEIDRLGDGLKFDL